MKNNRIFYFLIFINSNKLATRFSSKSSTAGSSQCSININNSSDIDCLQASRNCARFNKKVNGDTSYFNNENTINKIQKTNSNTKTLMITIVIVIILSYKIYNCDIKNTHKIII